MNRHPGKVVFVDGDTGRVVLEKDAAEVPEAQRFAGQVPVVKVVATVFADQRSVREYGADGALLRSTLQLRVS